MGFLALDSEPGHKRFLLRVLRCRGLKPITNRTWEIHGPHSPSMPYQVYYGPAMILHEDAGGAEVQVSVFVYARKTGGLMTHVYLMPDAAEWWQVGSGERLTATDHDRILSEWT